MRKLLFVLLMLPLCAFTLSITTGCGGSGETKIVEPDEATVAAEAAEAEADEEEQETTE